MSAHYNAVDSSGNSPYSQGSPYGSTHNADPSRLESTGFIAGGPTSKKGVSKWIKIGVPVALLIIIAAVLGGVLGSRHHSSSASAASAAASSAASAQKAIGVYATATNSEYMMPIYPSTVSYLITFCRSLLIRYVQTNTAAFTTPTFNPSNNAAWPKDPFKPSNPSPTSVRSDRPRLIAPAYKWAALPSLIANDPYLKAWNDTIFGNATDYYNLPPVVYFMDGDSGILDNARDVKRRVKAFAYVYRMTNDTKWVDRCYTELQVRIHHSQGLFAANFLPERR